MDDLVSIIMPSYNTAEFIGDSIKSVLAQTYTNWELIIVDDCSADNTDDVVASFSDNRIKYHKNVTNSGAAVSRNKALSLAKGKWVAFLDSDDLWLPSKIEKQVFFMKNNNIHFSYTKYEEIDASGNKTNVLISGPKTITHKKMIDYCWPGCLTVMYDASFVGLIQINDIKKNNDYAMWLKVSSKAICYLLPEMLALYRRGRTGSISSQKLTKMIRWHYKLWKECEENNRVVSFFRTLRNIFFGCIKKVFYIKKRKA